MPLDTTEEPVRTNYNRQQRRQAICVGAPRLRRRYKIAIAPRRLALTADGDLVPVAERIAEELDVSPELVDLLLPSHTAALTPH
jgi:hypothetical protein